MEHSAIEAGQDLHHIFQRHMSGRIKKTYPGHVCWFEEENIASPLEIVDG